MCLLKRICLWLAKRETATINPRTAWKVNKNGRQGQDNCLAVKVERDLVHMCITRRGSRHRKWLWFWKIHTHTHTHTYLLRVRSSTCLGQNLDSLGYAGFNCQDNNYDGDVQNTVDDEELSEKSESWKMFGLCHRGRDLGREGIYGWICERKSQHCMDAASPHQLFLPQVSRNETHSLGKILIHIFQGLTPGLDIELRSEFLGPLPAKPILGPASKHRTLLCAINMKILNLPGVLGSINHVCKGPWKVFEVEEYNEATTTALHWILCR